MALDPVFITAVREKTESIVFKSRVWLIGKGFPPDWVMSLSAEDATAAMIVHGTIMGASFDFETSEWTYPENRNARRG